MGLFDQFVGGSPPTEEDVKLLQQQQQQQQQALPPDVPPDLPRITVRPPGAAPNPFEQFVGGSTPPSAPPPAQPNKVFGELKPADESWTQWAKWKAMDALSAVGASNRDAQHFGNATVNIAAGLTPMGSVLSAGDLTYDLPRGNYGSAALDALGVIPGISTARRLMRGMPTMIPARTAPPYLQTTPSIIGGDNPQRMGFVTPTVDELIGRGGVPNVSSNAARAAEEASMPSSAFGPLPQPAATQPGSSRTAYAQIRYSPVQYAPEAADDVRTLATNYIQRPDVGGFSPEKAPLVHATLDRWQRAMNTRGGPITPSDFDTLRQQLRGLPDANGPAGQRAVDALDRYMSGPPPGRQVGGTPQDLTEMRQGFQTARGDYRAGKTAETVQNQIDRANINAASANSGMNVDNQTRQQMRSLVATPAGQEKIFGARDEELQAILDASRGDKLANWQRWGGNFLGGGGGLGKLVGMAGGGMGAGAISHALGLGPAASFGVGVAGTQAPAIVGSALKNASAARTVAAADDAVQTILRNSPEYERRLAAVGGPVVDPRVAMRDAITMALVPQIREEGKSAWNKAFVPYANR
jgi:hypothetical protein